MSTSQPPTTFRWTRERYERLAEAGVLAADDRIELIDGEIVRMSPQSSRHATAIRLVEQRLRDAFGEGFLVDAQLPLALGTHSEPEPDVAVVRGQPRDFVDAHPTTAVLVVEVAETSLAFDRDRKASLYARHDIPEYWIVNVGDRQLEVHRDPSGERYRTVTTHDAGSTVAPRGTETAVAVADLLP